VLLQGLDSTGEPIYTQDGVNRVQGEYVTLAAPFAQSSAAFLGPYLTGIQKDITLGYLQFFWIDPTTGAQTLFHTMEPGEQVAGYRRYYLNNLPCNCCHNKQLGVQPVQVTAIVKRELIPVAVDQDYCLFTSLEAITEECMSIRYSEMDSESSQKLAVLHHTNAVRYLQGELVHIYGKTNASVNFAPFGTAKLERQRIGGMI
jgi:hypothetical protein